MSGRLADNGTVLLHAYRTISRSIGEGRAITPAAEWLADNYYLVEREIQEIRTALPPGYYRQLPKLADGPFTGYPRVFGVAWAFVAHTDSHFNTELLCRFVRAYQEVQPLAIGELWAVAITLRIVLVENLRRLAELIMHSSTARQEANALADRLLGAGGHAAEPASIVLAEREGTALPEAFAVQLVHRLRDQDPENHSRADLARPASGCARIDGRFGGAQRAPEAGRRCRNGAQHHHQHAHDFRH